MRGENAGLNTLISLFLRRKGLFAVLILCAMTTVTAMHVWLPLYEARSSLVFETASSSSLQAVSAKLGTMGLQEDEGKELDRYAVRLNSPDFYRQVAYELIKRNDDLLMFHKEMQSSKRRIAWNFGKLFHIPLPSSSMKDLSIDEMADVLDSYVYFNRSGVDRINIVVRSGDRSSASIVANVIADMSVKVLLAEGLKDLDEAEKYLEVQAEQSEKSIKDIEAQLSELKFNHGLVSEETGMDSDSMQANGIQHQLTDATLEFDENQRQLERLRRELETEKIRDPSAANASIDPQNRYGIPRKISELTRANEMVALRQSALKKMLMEILHGIGQNDEQKIFDLHKRMEFDYSIYQELKKQAFQLEMRRIGARNKLRVFDHVRDMEVQRSDSLMVKLGIALILAIFGGLPVAVIWDLAWPRVRTSKDLVDAGLIYLGGIPVVEGRFAQDKRSNQGPKICRFDSDSEVAMSFIQVRSRLLYLAEQKDKSAQAVAVVSANSGRASPSSHVIWRLALGIWGARHF